MKAPPPTISAAGSHRVSDDDGERLTGVGSARDKAHWDSRCSVFCPMDRGLNTTIASGETSTSLENRMPFEPTARSQLGSTQLSLTRLGLGAASIGGLFEAVSDADAIATVDRAWELGVRMFDVAPLYGYGAAERRVGQALAGRPRDEYVLSTKVGRLVRPADAIPAGADIDTPGAGRPR